MPGPGTLGRAMAWTSNRWERRRRDKRTDTHDRTVVLVMSYYAEGSARAGLSPGPPKLPRHLFEALQDGDDLSLTVYDQVLHTTFVFPAHREPNPAT